MESSIAVFLSRQPACENKQRWLAGVFWFGPRGAAHAVRIHRRRLRPGRLAHL